MNKFITTPIVLALLLTPAALSAEQFILKNGLYVIGEHKEAVPVKTIDGQEIMLARPFTEPFEVDYLKSVSNDNDLIALGLEGIAPLSNDCEILALYADGFCLLLSGRSWDTGFHVAAEFSSLEAANAFAKFLNVPLLMRHHPGYALAAKFIPSKGSFSTTDAIPVTLEIKNVGSVQMIFWVYGKNRGEREYQFGFTASNGIAMVPDTGNPRDFEGSGVSKTLQPGETYTQEVDLRNWFTFEKPGTYEIKGTYLLRFFDPQVRSIFYTWEDYAAASFSITII